MIFSVRNIAMVAVLATASVLTAQEDAHEFRYGSRPSDGIFDPAEILLPNERKEIAEPLARVLKNEGIDVLVIVLPGIGAAPAKHVATGFREAWSEAAINAVVLHVPGDPESPWIFPGDVVRRVVVEPGKLEEWVSGGEARAAGKEGDFKKIRAAAIEAADIMRFCAGGAVIRTESIIDERLARQLEFERRQRLIKLAGMIGLAGIIPIVAGLAFFLARLRKSGARNFPPVRKVSRLGAPYSGGCNAVSNPKTH